MRARQARRAAEIRAAARAHVAGARKAIASEEAAVQEARTAFDKGDYLAAIDSRAATHVRVTRDLTRPTIARALRRRGRRPRRGARPPR